MDEYVAGMFTSSTVTVEQIRKEVDRHQQLRQEIERTIPRQVNLGLCLSTPAAPAHCAIR